MKAKKPTMFLITGFPEEKKFFDELGIPPEENSLPSMYEWYWIMTVEDMFAARALWIEQNPLAQDLLVHMIYPHG